MIYGLYININYLLTLTGPGRTECVVTGIRGGVVLNWVGRGVALCSLMIGPGSFTQNLL